MKKSPLAIFAAVVTLATNVSASSAPTFQIDKSALFNNSAHDGVCNKSDILLGGTLFAGDGVTADKGVWLFNYGQFDVTYQDAGGQTQSMFSIDGTIVISNGPGNPLTVRQDFTTDRVSDDGVLVPKLTGPKALRITFTSAAGAVLYDQTVPANFVDCACGAADTTAPIVLCPWVPDTATCGAATPPLRAWWSDNCAPNGNVNRVEDTIGFQIDCAPVMNGNTTVAWNCSDEDLQHNVGTCTVPTNAPLSCSGPPPDCLEVFHPGIGTVMFEDLHPRKGDFDFNDQTVAFQYELETVNGFARRLKTVFEVMSIGATIENGLFVRLPGIRPDQIASVVRYYAGGSPETLPGTGTVANENSAAVIQATANTFDLYPGAHGMINTDPSIANRTGKAFALVITFTSGVSPDLLKGFAAGNPAPFDLYLAQTHNYANQIHTTLFGPSDLGDQTRLNHFDDHSLEHSWGYYVDDQGIPFAISYPDFPVAWAKERTVVSAAFSQLVPWIVSSGTNTAAANWYKSGIIAAEAFPGVGKPALPAPVSADLIGPVFQATPATCH